MVHFNRSDVQVAICALVDSKWQFYDSLLNRQNNGFIGVDGVDYLIPANGTLLAIQNMT